MTDSVDERPLIQARDLTKIFGSRGLLGGGAVLHAVNGVNLDIRRGEAVGLVGESGSGKSTVGRLMLGLLSRSAGTVHFDGREFGGGGRPIEKSLRRRMQLVFQDPYSSLDPRRRIGVQIEDAMRIHDLMPPDQRKLRTAELLQSVGLPTAYASRYPHEFSGGQRQRIAIARALASSPEFLVADEPVSALDMSVQAQVMALLSELRRRFGLAMLFISHDLPVVRELCDRVAVMYLGRIMEEGPVDEIFERPHHPYTQALLSAAPSLRPERRKARILLEGDPPSPLNPPSGCVFRTRCRFATSECAKGVPPLRSIGPSGHRSACIRPIAPAADDGILREI
ncbi:Putative peptide import ATP-binding protein BruAb2_0797 [Hyphomicrobiales bacterium]|nr:Putative peptide import ATP-binding protein BruAb2_0797 [Hyphomicrobiales bacterium]CAH1691308.1 putative peptide import ATP-binding protein BAB2_0818 [Hyphomicrobiales bacterium]